jgi:hypothetical protein
MNSRELQADVPLATEESDEDELEFAELQTGTVPLPAGPLQVSNRISWTTHCICCLQTLQALGGSDSISGSLEDLVSTFDEKLTMCFADYQEQVGADYIAGGVGWCLVSGVWCLVSGV